MSEHSDNFDSQWGNQEPLPDSAFDSMAPLPALPESVRDRLLEDLRGKLSQPGGAVSRKVVKVTDKAYKAVKIGSVNTDIKVPVLIQDAVLETLQQGTPVSAASEKVAKGRTRAVNVEAPDWWWLAVRIACELGDYGMSDIVETAIAKHLPRGV